MAGPQKTKQGSPRRPAAPAGHRASAPTVEHVARLAWAGQHTQAIESASAALEEASLGVGLQVDLLDLRAESFIALGDLARAGADTAAMRALARRERSVAFEARALQREALVQMRRGEPQAAVITATRSLKAARKSGQPHLEATSMVRLAEARFRSHTAVEAAAKDARRAAAIFESLGDKVLQGRALWTLQAALNDLSFASEGDRAGAEALALARQAGDLFGQGNVLNSLTFNEGDIAVRLRMLNQALALFEAAGYLERQGMIFNNLAGAYTDLGLYRRARRLYRETIASAQRTGQQAGLLLALWQLSRLELLMGHADAARALVAEAVALTRALKTRLYAGWPAWMAGHLAVHEARPLAAAQHFEEAAATVLTASEAIHFTSLAHAGSARLGAGAPAEALALTRRAADWHVAKGLLEVNGIDPQVLWWQHSQALRANGLHAEARVALARAYGFLRDGLAGLSDEGLRRNSLNKPVEVREIVLAWLADARAQGLPRAQREAHLIAEASLREPFERLVDTGLRLNEIRTADQLHEFLIDEATELSGAERVLLVLESPGASPRLAGSLLPRGESEQALLTAVTPWLDEARRTRAVSLRHGPEGAEPVEQRSCLVAPLIAQRELLGYLYCDIEGAFGRFHDADRDLLAMLAAQAAVALANLRFAEGLEQKVAERTAQLEQRAGELALINGIQQGMAAEMNFQAIVDLVGDKLREVFRTGDLGINWWDEKAWLMHHLYSVEHGARLHSPPHSPEPGGIVDAFVRRPHVFVFNSQAEQLSQGVPVQPGTDRSRSVLGVPLLAGERLLGNIIIEDHERDHAFGEAEVRLLQTLAGSMSVALENARLFDETQRLLKETEQRAAELAIINTVQQGLASKLDMQAIYDLVGEKIREIFDAQVVGIATYDAATDELAAPFLIERR